MPLVAGWGIECKKGCAFPLPFNKLRGPIFFIYLYAWSPWCTAQVFQMQLDTVILAAGTLHNQNE